MTGVLRGWGAFERGPSVPHTLGLATAQLVSYYLCSSWTRGAEMVEGSRDS